MGDYKFNNLAIGKTFINKKKNYRVQESIDSLFNCKGCAFEKVGCGKINLPFCGERSRRDKKNVIFVGDDVE